MKKLFLTLAVAALTLVPALADTVVIVETSCGKIVVATTEANLTLEEAEVVSAVIEYYYC